MRILGIDCGTATTGWAVIEPIVSNHKTEQKEGKSGTGEAKYKVPVVIACGVINTHKFSPEEDRLRDLGESLLEIIVEFSPQDLAIEDIYFFKNAKTVIKVSQARGVVIYNAVKSNLKCFSYTPLQVKNIVTGYGKADKKQVMEAVNDIFHLGGKLTQDDAADALAVAYSHYMSLR